MQQRASIADLKEQEKDSINLKIGHFKIFREECKKILKSKTNKKTNKKQVSYRTPSQEMIFLLWHPRKSTQRKWQNSYLKKVKVKSLSRVLLFATPWTVAYQFPLSVGFCRQEYWSGLPCLSPGDLPNPGTEPMSFTSPALAGGFFTTSTTWESCCKTNAELQFYLSPFFFLFSFKVKGKNGASLVSQTVKNLPTMQET